MNIKEKKKKFKLIHGVVMRINNLAGQKHPYRILGVIHILAIKKKINFTLI